MTKRTNLGMMDQAVKPWERQPCDTDKSFAAFCVYRDLTPYGDPQRSLKNTKAILGLRDGGALENWSAKNKWVDRVAAYDAWNANNSITLVQASKEEFASQLVSTTSARLAFIGNMVEKMMKHMDEKITLREDVDPADVKRLVEMVKTIDDLGRRAAGLATTYNAEIAPIKDDDNQTYVVGGGARDASED